MIFLCISSEQEVEMVSRLFCSLSAAFQQATAMLFILDIQVLNAFRTPYSKSNALHGDSKLNKWG
jgi:hypothetical protein